MAMPQMKLLPEGVTRVDGHAEFCVAADDQPDVSFGKVQVIPVTASTCRTEGVAEASYRALEIIIAAIALSLASPAMLLIAIVIRLDSPGPALFLHKRPAQSARVRGRDLEGRRDLRAPPNGYDPDAEYWAPAYFTFVKFRTMYRDARTRFPAHFPDEYAREDFRSQFPHVENDPRITRVGRVLRRLSLDELPNLWSVLVGDIRLVGPRPELPEVLKYHTAEEMIRFTCKPGITGLSQIGGRKMLTWGETLSLDLEYVRTSSIMLDLKIIFLTVKKVVTAHGAL